MKYLVITLLTLPLYPQAAPLTLTNPTATISHTLHVDIADTQTTRQTGLMHRKTLCPTCGMLFVYPELANNPQTIHMWMRNTLIPLDMIFLRGSTVAGIHGNAKPHDETIITSPKNVTGVLEVNGGWAQTHGVTTGWNIITND